MNGKELKVLEELGNLPMVSGYEEPFLGEFKDIVDEYLGKSTLIIDNNIVYLPKSPLSNLVFFAHLDEIGFIVDNQYSPTLYRTIPVGLIEPSKGYGKVMQTNLGGRIVKAIGSSPLPHEKPSEDRLFLELFEDIEIPPKWPFTYENRVFFNENYVYSKALDDRAGVIALLSVARKYKIPFVLSSGEEQGFSRFRGVLEFFEDRLKDPSYIIVDSFTSKEDVHIMEGLSENQLGYIAVEGDGVGNMAPKSLVKLVKPYVDVEITTHSKFEVTDATALYRLGRPAISIGYPLKYLHSSFEVLPRLIFDRLKKTIVKIAKNH